MTRHSVALMRIITSYMGMPPSQVLLDQISVYIEGQIERAEIKTKNEVAAEVCEGLHDGPPKMGVLCRSCYEAEKNAPGIIEIESRRQIREMDEFRKAKAEEGERSDA